MRKRNEFITTFTGKRFHLFNPTASEIDIVDMTHSLSMQCRFNGHIKHFYSVASHLLIGAKLIENKFKKEFLCHDFSETYTGDCVTPLKRQLNSMIKVERNIEKVINKKYGVPFPMSKEVKEMDNLMFRMERAYLTNYKTDEKFPMSKKEFMKEISKTHKQVERELLKTFNKIN